MTSNDPHHIQSILAATPALYEICQSGDHCSLCRKGINGKVWRAKTFPIDHRFACPFGKPWDGPSPIRGLGDVIAKVAQAAGIKPCNGCKKRRDKLNKAVPMGNK